MVGAEITLSEALRRATIAFKDGKFAEAEQLCQKIIIAKPDFFAAVLLIATVQLALTRPRDALARYDQVLAVWPRNATALHNRGVALYNLGRFEDALASYDQALAVRPGEAATHNNRGNTLRELSRFNDALASYDEAVALKPDYVDAYYNRANLLQKLKRLNEALASYDEVIALKPDYADALFQRGAVLQKSRRLNEALASYDKVIALKPDHADALFQRGAVLEKLRRLNEALASYDKAIALKPELGPVYQPIMLAAPADVSETIPGVVCEIGKGEQGRRVYWCLGMHASASTWTYNVVRQIATSLYPTLPVQEHFVLTFEDVARLGQLGCTHVVKTHNIADEDAVGVLSKQANAIIITIRDPRDAVTSFMQYHPYRHGQDLAKPSETQKVFDRSLSLVEGSARLCARFAGDHRSLLLLYETGFPDDVMTLDRIAAGLRGSLAATDRNRIFASGRRAAVEDLIAELPHRRTTLIDKSSGDLMDSVSHWHTFHAGRTGEIGRWRHTLTETQVLEVEQRLGDWMDHFAYQRCQM
jgi:tetratricopeptide (TPR) repeat protein